MAFNMKTWVDRITEYPTRRRLRKEDGSDELVTVSREEGQISEEGDAFSAENMNDLESRIDTAFKDVNNSLVDMDTALQGVKNFHFRYKKDISIQGNGNWPVNAFDGFKDIPLNKIAYVGISMSAYSGTRPDVLWNTYNNNNRILIHNNSGYVHWNMLVLYTD